MQTTQTYALKFKIGARTVTEAEVARWEERRAEHVMRTLRRRLHHPESVSALATSASNAHKVATLKARVGSQAVAQAFAWDLWLSDIVARLAVWMSGGRYREVAIEVTSPRGSAGAFLEWYRNSVAHDEQAMIAACPDHHLLQAHPDGRQEVVETTGGSPLASRFFIDYRDTTSVSLPVLEGYPLQIAGTARLANGLVVGGIRHQFRDEGPGFRARLGVMFPAIFPRFMTVQHAWHLACEFGNWILEANDAQCRTTS